MVHVVIFGEGSYDDQLNVVQDAANGWIQVRPGTWFIGTVLSAADTRSYIQENGMRAVVTRLTPDWATTAGMGNVGQWLKGAGSVF